MMGSRQCSHCRLDHGAGIKVKRRRRRGSGNVAANHQFRIATYSITAIGKRATVFRDSICNEWHCISLNIVLIHCPIDDYL